MDVVADILHALRLRGTVYFRARFHAPWGMVVPRGAFANFHVVTDGTCWVRGRAGSTFVRLGRGDMAVFPRGDTHALSCAPDAAMAPAASFLERTRRETEHGVVFGESGEPTTGLICGHFEYDRELTHPLFETLDEMLIVKSRQDSGDGWLVTAADLAANASAADEPGSSAVVDRLAEALLIQALAAYVVQRADGAAFLHALNDRQIGRVLALMHEDIARNWTLDSLAASASLSRSHFAERFRALVGETPMVYLARWRMIRARELLRATRRPLGDISEAVGYTSEFAFAKAFKKITGETPGAVRKGGNWD